MPPKKRPAQITALTGDRKVKAQQFLVAVCKAKKYCGKSHTEENLPRVETATGGDCLTRSRGSKKLFSIHVPGCLECNLRNIEAFQEEYLALMKEHPLVCDHGIQIQNIVALGEERATFTPITIPRLAGILGLPLGATGGRRSVGSGSSVSTVTIEKLEREKTAVEKQFEELCHANEELTRALVQVE